MSNISILWYTSFKIKMLVFKKYIIIHVDRKDIKIHHLLTIIKIRTGKIGNESCSL